MFSRHVQMREDRVALEHHVGRPLVGRHRRHRLAVDEDLALRSGTRSRRACAAAWSCRSPRAPAARRTRRARMSNETSSTACTGPKCLEMSRRRDDGVVVACHDRSECRRLAGLHAAPPHHLGEDDEDEGERPGCSCRAPARRAAWSGKRSWLQMKIGSVASVPLRKKAMHELVERDGEGQQQARDDAGQRQRKGHPPERHPAVLAQIERGLLEALVEAFEARRSAPACENGMQSRTWPAPIVHSDELDDRRPCAG